MIPMLGLFIVEQQLLQNSPEKRSYKYIVPTLVFVLSISYPIIIVV